MMDKGLPEPPVQGLQTRFKHTLTPPTLNICGSMQPFNKCETAGEKSIKCIKLHGNGKLQ